MSLAIFDFDGTLYQGETLRLFLKVIAKIRHRRGRLRWFYLTYAPVYILYKLGIAHQAMIRVAMKGLAKILAGMNEQELQQLYQDVYAEARPNFCPIVTARLEQHRKAGDRVLLLSGALDGFIAFVAAHLDVAEWIGSELEVVNGVCTGKMNSILMADEKVQAIRRHSGVQIEEDLKNAVAYADGIRDLPLLELVKTPVAVHPEPELAKVAEVNGWEIIR